jgi:hypothetical protein
VLQELWWEAVAGLWVQQLRLTLRA